MEFDSQSLCSDEGVELTITDHGELYPGDYHYMEDNEPSVLEAKIVYLLMPKNVPISRAKRLQWLLDHLNVVITVPSLQKISETTNDLEIISAVPRDQTIVKCNRFLVTSETEVKFLAHTYRFVYCLDMSPSQSSVDIQRGQVLFDEILVCFKTTLEAITRQFTIPGNSLVFQPCIYLTVMVNTPFFMSPAQQVLVKGVQITNANVNSIIDDIEKQFYLLEWKIAEVSVVAHEQLDIQRTQHEGIVGRLFDLPDSTFVPKIPMVTADANFVNMLRYSMLAISLLPEISISHILVITDGIVAMPDFNIMETLLYQLHYDSIAVSFLKVGSSFHPHSSAGYIPYVDLLHFLSNSTLGSCFETFPDTQHEPSMSINPYQEVFLLWSFQRINKHSYPKNSMGPKWSSPNESFYSHKPPCLLAKKQTEEKINASILLMLGRRLREGFTVDNIYLANGDLEVKLSLQWKCFIYINYKITSEWPVTKNNVKFEINILGPYEFLHDLTCQVKKDQKSANRQAIIKRFWMRLSQLSTEDINLAQNLSSFQISNKDWHILPESIRNGIPVFTLNMTCGDTTKLILSLRDVSSTKFVHVWQTIASMETNVWRKWLHTHKISLILKHDNPLPKHLHLPNSSLRYQVVQCRQATTALYNMLSEWGSFVLIDNHTYVKFLYSETEKTPTGFCLVRVTSKFPCAVLNLGFLSGTPGHLRQTVCNELKSKLSDLSYLISPSGKAKENECCVLLQKPIEKILIRYERIPSSFTTVVFPDGTQPPNAMHPLQTPISGSLFTTLSRYLYHKRWIWSASHSSNPRLADSAISRILSTLTGMRIKEGFSFAHSSSGIITMVLELWMDQTSSCVVQYVLFPPHYAWCTDDFFSGSEEENDVSSDNETEMQLVTEVWIEPQYGKVLPSNPRITYMDNKYYYEIADVICKIDMQCINSLLTMEHLSLMCQDKTVTCNMSRSLNRIMSNTSRKSRKSSRNSYLESPLVPDYNGSQYYPIVSPRIEHIPFKFDPINILPLCQQTELLFSMFIEGKESSLGPGVNRANTLLLNNILEHLAILHDQELDLTKEESKLFTDQILRRHQNRYPHVCPIDEELYQRKSHEPLWRCFLKGISVTHVILTFIPSTLPDLKSLVCNETKHIPNLNDSLENSERTSSRTSNFSDVPINFQNSLCLPVYVFDCPLAMLVKAYMNNTDETTPTNDDIYEDHRFKANTFIYEEYTKLKSDGNENCDKNEDCDTTETRNVRSHCKALVLAHSKCFTISLFVALHSNVYVHSYDVQSAMDQCEDFTSEIDITDYIMTICGHVKNQKDNKIMIDSLNQAIPCTDLSSLHSLIKDKFLKIIGNYFYPIPTNEEFYYYHSLSNVNPDDQAIDSDDEISNNFSEIMDLKSERDYSLYSEDRASDNVENDNISPLFLHLICTLKYNNGQVSNTSVRVLPTCLGELVQHLEPQLEYLDATNTRVTLDILYITLPNEVQNIITNYSTQGMRTTSFCSDTFQPSIDSSISDGSYASEIPMVLPNLPEPQKKTILTLKEEINWLLKDEIATALLDVDPVKADTLRFVTNHVADGSPASRTSCIMDLIRLNFVYVCKQSYEKFVEEFSKIELPSYYKLCKEEEFYYIAKDSESLRDRKESGCYVQNDDKVEQFFNDGPELSNIENLSLSSNGTGFMSNVNQEYDPNKSTDEVASQVSDISNSLNGSALETEGGYDEDDSEDYEDYTWLEKLNKKRQHLPNFWLIMKIEQELVTIYFHCRFLEMQTLHVGLYQDVQRSVSDAIKDLCKRVNQLLLLQNLYDSKICDTLLEPDDNCSEASNSPISRNTSCVRLKSMDETSDESDIMAYSASLSEASLNFKAGFFSCPVVWETRFVLHPRLKTGPGKSGISRGILALKHILDKFSVSNRNNMFVYKDTRNNVFYLRLHENLQYPNKGASRSYEYENGTVSRSPSMASLPLAQNKSNLTQSEQSINSLESRPRLRSYGEKECKEGPSEDTLILKVHGITDAGDDVKLQLVQVLQNRLDDAVLEFLSVMLARNSMWPLTPEDVQFIQRPFKLPEEIIRFTIQEYVASQYLDSFVCYLKQNLLQFLNNPKYTDNKAHFKDYSDNNDTAGEDSIFIYNQGQNPSSGNRGIACIALAIISNVPTIENKDMEASFQEIFAKKLYEPMLVSEKVAGEVPQSYIEFRLWKQGRVNIDNLAQKLMAAISQATWDIVTEYYLLKKPLCVDKEPKNIVVDYKIDLDSSDLDLSKEIEFVCILDSTIENENVGGTSDKHSIDEIYQNKLYKRSSQKSTETEPSEQRRSQTFEVSAFDSGSDGILSDIYAKYLPSWLEFGYNLNVPSVRKLMINLSTKHVPNVTVKEILGMLQDTSREFCAVPLDIINKEEYYTPHFSSSYFQKCVVISRNMEQWAASLETQSCTDYPEVLRPNVVKHTQKFVPEIVNDFLIPRQKILWLVVDCETILIYTYNWTKDNIDKLNKNCNNLGLWLSVRSCFLNSGTSQKLGLFHNPSLTRKQFMMASNPYKVCIGDTDFMMEYPKEHKQRKRPQSGYNLHSIVEAFRDSFRPSKFSCQDPVVMLTYEMHEMKSIEKKQRDEMKKLHNMYQSRTSTTTVSQIFLLMQNSRIIHYCHTPLLFLSRWRLKSAATRDHSLYPSQAMDLADRLCDEDKESWHTELCYSFFTDYRQYLQTLGFMPLQIDNPHKTTNGLWTKDKSSYNSVFFIQKTILGGILVFTVEFNEPFFITKLHVIECNRLQNINSRASINRFTISFLDECDRVKILMHLHSFTYDYHLRCIYNYLTMSPTANKLCDAYNVHQFLDDFMKYYNKTPNFARNLVYTDTLTIKDLVTEGKQLYEYLLSNVAQYNFKVFNMDHIGDMEYILVQVTSTPQVSYKDSQDRQHTDDFDITLVVYNLCTPYSPQDTVLHLKYYLILTSKREIYPKCDVEQKLGKFRTVSSTARSLSALERNCNDLESSITKTTESETDAASSEDDHTTYNFENESDGDNTNVESSLSQQSSIPHVEICQESVNYLGYYSSHEQLMHQLILDKAETTQKHIKDMVAKGMVHCRTYLLWNRLISPHDSNMLSYEEFMELKGLAKLDHLCDLHPNLGPLLNQKLSWYQGLAKLLLVKYNDQHRTFISSDGNIQHYVILHPNYFGAFMLLSIDLHTSRGELYAVYREPHKQEDAELCLAYQKNLLDGFVNCISFYLWSEMLSN